MKKNITLLSALLLSTLLSARADILSQWTFETSVPAGQPGAGIASANSAPEVGSGIAFGLHAGNSVYSNPAGNGSVKSFSSTLWAVGDFYQFQFSTTGFTGIGISFDQTSSGTGPRDFSLSFSVNGSPFTALGGGSYSVLANATPNPTWNPTTSSPLYSFSFDLSFAGVDNATTVDIRLANASTVSASGGGRGYRRNESRGQLHRLFPRSRTFHRRVAWVGPAGFQFHSPAEIRSRPHSFFKAARKRAAF